VREGQELGGKLLGGLEIGLMPGVDLAERRIWNPVTEIASAGDDLIVGASDNERRAPDSAGFCVDVDAQIKLHLPRQTLPVRAGENALGQRVEMCRKRTGEGTPIGSSVQGVG
jgi:hypothetical protein